MFSVSSLLELENSLDQWMVCLLSAVQPGQTVVQGHIRTNKVASQRLQARGYCTTVHQKVLKLVFSYTTQKCCRVYTSKFFFLSGVQFLTAD